jgi:hypothetical protein
MRKRPEDVNLDHALRTTVYRDAQGNRTDDPRRAVSGEILERGEEVAPRRTWFRVEQVELEWLPVSETAFLLWVLALLVLAWLIVALVLLLL